MRRSNISFGLCCWNFWGDGIVDRPDNTDEMVVSYIVNWLLDHYSATSQNLTIYQLQHMDPIAPVWTAEVAGLRKRAYEALQVIGPGDTLPELEIIFCRWRWDVGAPNDPRLKAQQRMLDHYGGTRTRILIWDEDYQIDDETLAMLKCYPNVELIETSEMARRHKRLGWVYAPHPIRLDRDKCLRNILGPPGHRNGDHLEMNMRLAYVGNNYERQEYLDKYLTHSSNRHPGTVHLYGNWLKYSTDINHQYPGIAFHTKVGRHMRDWVYQHSLAVPMLAKKVYFDLGHITPRLHEVVSAGGIPIGFTEFMGVDRYYPDDLIVSDDRELALLVDEISGWDRAKRRGKLYEQVDKMIDEKVFDVDEFFRCIGVA
jgi:hypothetical protein